MLDTYCGLRCMGCSFKASHGCEGCIETKGKPFHGECPIATCCRAKSVNHCGECSLIPCEKQYAYSYTDPEHGDQPPGKRVAACRICTGEKGIHTWRKVLLTSAGWETADGEILHNLRAHFISMLDKDVKDTRVLLVTAAAIDDGAKAYAELCRAELCHAGIRAEFITDCLLDEPFEESEALKHDVVYFVGGDTAHLLKRVKAAGFDAIVKKMVCMNKVYIGVSAGSLLATPNIGDLCEENTAGLALVNALIKVHCEQGTEGESNGLPLISLSDRQALAVSYNGYEIITG